MSEGLRSIPKKLEAAQRDEYQAGLQSLEYHLILRHAEPISVVAVDDLMNDMHDRARRNEWDDRAKSDRWLAPRVHYALRLFRAEASDRGIFQWLALRYAWYLEWRWADQNGQIADDRWWGPIHKQAFARLWWGAEIFRDGSDYRPVERAFVFQDLPNSYLHRPLVRCRSLALAVVDRVNQSTAPSADQVNSLARVLNLATVGTPPEVESDYQVDDFRAYNVWAQAIPSTNQSWDDLPKGPLGVDTTENSRQGGARIVSRGWEYAQLD